MKFNFHVFSLQLLFIASILTLTGIQDLKAGSVCNDTIEIPFYYRLGSNLLMHDYRENKKSLSLLEDALRLESNYQLINISITGMTSPEGTIERNTLLSRRRASALRNHILWKFPHINDSIVQIPGHANNMLLPWIEAVESDDRMPRKEKVLQILYSDKGIPTKWANIQLLVGNPADYMRENTFPLLRNAISCVVTLRKKEAEQSIPPPSLSDTIEEMQSVADTLEQRAGIAPFTPETMLSQVPKEYIYTPLFAAKTNLLFDIASLLNVEIEVPLGKRFSVATEWIFPWWLWEDKQHCLELLNGNIEGRYWLGNRNKRDLMTGWFIGLYAGGGYYDLEWDKKGYQGEFFIATGLSTGFSHKIAKNLRMEYSLGVGYMQTKYREYEARLESDNEWHLYRRDRGKYTWIGPTKARISLVWMLYSKKEKGGAK